MRPIDADALKERKFPNGESEYTAGWNDAISAIMTFQPTIEAEPVRHGKWIDEGQNDDFFPHHAWRCSECGEQVLEIGVPWYTYCPNCGADMRGAENGDK